MFWKVIKDRYVISRDGEQELFGFAAGEFAEIAYASAWRDSDSLLITAARREADRASVDSNRKGKYHAYRVSATGIEQLSNEYTNTAIPLPRGGIAYSNGSSLVAVVDGKVRSHKIGRFNWGPVSLSSNESGSLIAMTKWKGDDRKLAHLDLATDALQVSRFSFSSYVLFEREIVHVLSGDVTSVDAASGKSKSITPQAVRRNLLEHVGLGKRNLEDVVVQFRNLSIYEGGLIVHMEVQDNRDYHFLWRGIVALPHGGKNIKTLYVPEGEWHVAGVTSRDETLCISLELYKEMKTVNWSVVALGRAASYIQNGWRPIANPRLPETGFQFLPGT